MFRKLLLKLTVLNASVIAILFCALIAGAYLYSQHVINRHSQFFLSKVAADINAGRRPPMFPGNPPPAPPHEPPPSRFSASPPSDPPDEEIPHPVLFYVKLDATGAISTTSTSLPLSVDQLKELVQMVGTNSESSGHIIFQNIYYYFYRTERQDAPGNLVLFQNFEREHGIFRTVMTALAIIGVFCFIASLFGSLFLARRAMNPIQKAWTQQRDFLADASHELRTPLAVIQANLDVVQGNTDELVSEQTPWLTNIGESVKSMASLVESLLFLARIDSPQHLINTKAFALDQAITDAMEPYKVLANAKKIKLSSSLSAGLELLGDEQRIKQVLCILLDNALRHTPEGGEINITLQQTTKNVDLIVSDNGEGIPPEHLGKIFDRFYQVDPSRNKGGAGLGLAIARCIVEIHGGSIHAISKPGTGAIFIVRLPITSFYSEKQSGS